MSIPSRRINRLRTTKDLQSSIPDDSSGKAILSYQPLKLDKEMCPRMFKDTSILALKKTNGLKPVPPEMSFEKSILSDLFPSSDENEDPKCEFLIVVAMYNESSEHFTNTLNAVAENLEYFYKAGISPEKIACIVIVDGMRPFLQTYNKQKPFFSQFFDEDQVKRRFNTTDLMFCEFPGQQEYDEFAHVFSQEIILGNAKFPLKLIMCVKQFNRRKLNSHLWFFGGFCEEIQPKYVMLLDVGTKPLEGALFFLYEAMVCDKQLAGCCGEIKPMNYNMWRVVVPAQLVEYKFSHILDKALESLIGYITVLPGAFSAYRWEALQGEPMWEDYFKSICHPELMDAFQSNIYLAEDRVLCLSLVTKKDHKYILRYVKKSVAETDVPESISELLAQRRRWINGSWFALVDAVWKIRSIFRSKHNIIRKCCFTLQMLYYILSVIYTWFIVGAFCLALAIALKSDTQKGDNEWVNDILLLIYVSVIIVIFITSLGVKPRRVEDFYKALSFILGCYQVYILYLVLMFCKNAILDSDSDDKKQVAVTIGSTFGLLAFIVLINCEVVTILKGVIHYIFLIPTYVNIFFIYSICNVHDCTWGNRPDALTAEEKERLEEFEEFRTRWTILWALCNSGFAYVINQFNKSRSTESFYFLGGISLAGIGVIIIRVLGGFLYLFDECCKRKIKKGGKKRELSIVPESSGHQLIKRPSAGFDSEAFEDKDEYKMAPFQPVEESKNREANDFERFNFEVNPRVKDETGSGSNRHEDEKDGEKKKKKKKDRTRTVNKKKYDSSDKKERKRSKSTKSSKNIKKIPPILKESEGIESKVKFAGFDLIGEQIDNENNSLK